MRLVLIVCAACAGAPANAAAQAVPEVPATPDEADGASSFFPKARLGAHGAFTWEGGFGVGARVDFPILREQISSDETRDEIAVSAGLDLTFIRFGSEGQLEAWPTATVQWTLAVDERSTFFPELGLVAHVERGGWDGFYPNIGFGGRYYVYESLSLTGRLGWPMALSVGAAF